MTHVIKVNCKHIWSLGFVLLWISLSSASLFGIYVQQVTLSTYSNNDDCHIGYFNQIKWCQSTFYDQHRLLALEGGGVADKGETTMWLSFFIGLTIFIQIVLSLVLNSWKKWVKIECINKTLPDIPSKEEAKK